MEKCEICGLETDDLYECSYCGRLLCKGCGGDVYVCDDCWQDEYGNTDNLL